MTTDKNNAAPDPQPAELAEQQGVALPPLPRMREFTSLYGRVSAFGPDQMRDYARAAFAAGATAASTGAVLVNMGDSEAEFIRMGNDESALAATGKQQVGEVQGDGLREAAMAVVGHIVTDTQPAHDAKQQLVAALAARQPGAQVPITVEAVATIERDSDGDSYVSFLLEGGISELEVGDVLMVADRSITDDDGSGEVYAAPPAQGIDLGQEQDAARWRWVREQNGVTVSVEEADDDGDMTFVSGHTPDELDAAIDGQRDAAPGVGNG